MCAFSFLILGIEQDFRTTWLSGLCPSGLATTIWSLSPLVMRQTTLEMKKMQKMPKEWLGFVGFLNSNLASDGAQTNSSLCFSYILVIIISNLSSDWTFHIFNKVFAAILSVVELLMSHMHTLPDPAEVISWEPDMILCFISRFVPTCYSRLLQQLNNRGSQWWHHQLERIL